MIDQRYMYEQRLHQRRARNGHKFRGGKGGSCLVRAWTENHRKPSTTRVFPNFQGLSVCAIGDTAERTLIETTVHYSRPIEMPRNVKSSWNEFVTTVTAGVSSNAFSMCVYCAWLHTYLDFLGFCWGTFSDWYKVVRDTEVHEAE